MKINQKNGFWIHSLKMDLTEKLCYKIKFSITETVTKTFMYILKRLLAKFQVTLRFQNRVFDSQQYIIKLYLTNNVILILINLHKRLY